MKYRHLALILILFGSILIVPIFKLPQVKALLAPPTEFKFMMWRYQNPSTNNDCQWMDQHSYYIYGDSLNTVSCLANNDANVAKLPPTVMRYQDLGVLSSDPMYVAFPPASHSSDWIHFSQDGSVAHWTFAGNNLYLPNYAALDIQTFIISNWLPSWSGFGGIFQDDFASVIPDASDHATIHDCGLASCRLTEYVRYEDFLEVMATWAGNTKTSMGSDSFGRPFVILPNVGAYSWIYSANQTRVNMLVSFGGMADYDGLFLEGLATPYAYDTGGNIGSITGIEARFDASPRKGSLILELFTGSGAIPSDYWLASYYLLARNGTSLHLNFGFNYPVPSGFGACPGNFCYNATYYDNLILGNAGVMANPVDIFGDHTASYAIRHFQFGVVVTVVQDRTWPADVRSFNVSLGGTYRNALTNVASSSVTLSVYNGTYVGLNQTGIPTPPLNLQASSSGLNVHLSWLPPASNGGSAITNYLVYGGQTSGGEVFFQLLGNVTSVTINNAGAGGQTLYFYVTAANSYYPPYTSPPSNEASVTLQTVSSAPRNFGLTVYRSNISLTWIAPSSTGGAPISSYNVYRGTTSGGETLLASVSSITFLYYDTTANLGVTYFYMVKAVNSVGESPASPELSGVGGISCLT